MNIFKSVPTFDFYGKVKIFSIVSTIFIFVSIISMAVKGFNYGVDFKGGTLIQIQFAEPASLDEVRSITSEAFPQGIQITRFGDEANNELLFQINDVSDDSSKSLDARISEIITGKTPDFSIRRIETIGPKIGEELKLKALYAVLTALFGILIYTAFRFKFSFGLAAILCLFHDIIIILGVFSLFDLSFDLTTVAAILTIVGYSLNDTIVVFDRVRENLVKAAKITFPQLINLSVNETLNRTIMTSFSTFVVVSALFLFGGEIIKDFSFAICIGIIVGTYSSIFIACPLINFTKNIKFSTAK